MSLTVAIPSKLQLLEESALSLALADFGRRPVRSPRRAEDVQNFLAGALTDRGYPATIELPIKGAYRTHDWDVATSDLPLRAISVRSLVTSWAKNKHNRLDDMLAEAVNLRREHPEARVGYLGLIVGDTPECLRVLEQFRDGVAARCGPCPEQFNAAAVIHVSAPAPVSYATVSALLASLLGDA